jgi:AraC-like DNA-binding protein
MLRTDSPEEAEHFLQSIFGASRFEPAKSQRTFPVQANYKPLKAISLSYCSYDSPVVIHFPEAPFYRKGFLIGGQGKFLADGTDVDIATHNSGIVPPNTRATADYGEQFRQLLLRIETSALHSKLTALIGAPPSREIEFLPSEANDDRAAALRRLVVFVAGEIDSTSGLLPPQVLEELEEAVLLTFLLAHRNNFSDLLEGPARESAPRQVKLAEEFIEANWNAPLTVETIANAVGTSARSVFQSFRQARGYSPMQFAKSVRLKRARLRLQNPSADTTVTGVALECGFHNMGHFAVDYKQQFGELPSETLRLSKLGARLS